MAGTGIVARVAGVVVDAEFASGDLPSIHNALLIQRDDGPELVLEVQEHIEALVAAGFTETFTESRGGMLRQAQYTLFIAVEKSPGASPDHHSG